MLIKTLKLVKNFLSISVPGNSKREFVTGINRVNVARAKITSIVFIILEIMQIAASYIIKRESLLKKPNIYYVSMYILMFLVMTA